MSTDRQKTHKQYNCGIGVGLMFDHWN